ncbi:MAG: starch synthase, partial [Kamptonema sp. SIO4C4]|nr:starch synthase [Kamptonema sp. SIO4C4]
LFFTCIVRAWESFRYPDSWRDLQKRGMMQNFSWDNSAREYIKMYKELLGLPTEQLLPEEKAVMGAPASGIAV